MSGSRVIFTRFTNAESVKLRPWREHRRKVVGATVEPVRTSADGSRYAVVWQLISANNRELARSADEFDAFEDAVLSAREAVDLVKEHGVMMPVSSDQMGTYGWYISILGHPVVICSRWYASERARQHAARLTLESLPVAELAAGARQYVDTPVSTLRLHV